MKVLVAYAGRHGSTRDIARAIGEELQASGVDADARPAGDPGDVDAYDAVVLGSAVYRGSWLGEARRFAEAHRDRLAQIPAWLFSSGPLGTDEPTPQWEPRQIPDLMRATGARDHRIFPGRLDRGRLGLFERLVVRMVRAPEGDFRDWEAIRGWAREIAAGLKQTARA